MLEYVKTQIGGVTLTLPIADLAGETPLEGLLLVDVKGLGPPSAIVQTEGGPTTPGASVSYVKVEKRNIILTVVVLETAWWGDTDYGRETIYKRFPVGKEVRLAVKKSSRAEELIINGIVESCEVNLFSQNENVDISIICPIPFFTTDALTNHDIPTDRPAMIAYGGDADTGFVITTRFYGATGDITIDKNAGEQIMTIDMSIVEAIVGVPSANHDQLIIDTRIGSKSITYTNNMGQSWNVMSAFVPGSSWFFLYAGFNQFHYSLSPGSASVDMHFSYPELIMGL